MKFVLFCDLLRAPREKTKSAVVGIRLSGAAVKQSNGESDADFRTKLDHLFDSVRNRSLPKPGESGFGDYLNDLGQNAGPLFPWIGGELGFSFLWASAKPDEKPTAVDPNGVASRPILVPTIADASKHANFELTDASFRWLLYTALSDLVSGKPKHTDKFTIVAPFKIFGWDDKTGRQAIGEVDDDGRTTSNFRYEAFMAGLASLPAPIPHGRLNLVRFAELTSVKAAPAGQIPLLIAAPRFKPLGTTSWLEPRFDNIVDPNAWNVLKPNIIATIPYLSDFGGHGIEVICRALNLEENLTDSYSFLQRESFWVGRRHFDDGTAGDSRDGVGFDDWLARLPELVADVFDLPRVVLQAMENDTKRAGPGLTDEIAKGGRLDGAGRISEAVLIALRDIVGPGCLGLKPDEALRGPNGSPAHAMMIDQVNFAFGQFRSDLKLDATERAALLADVIRYDNDFRESFRSGTGDAGRLAWLDILARVLGPALELPTAGDNFLEVLKNRVAIDAAAAGAFDPLPLRRVVDAATNFVNAGAIQAALWRAAKAGALTPKLEAWLSATSEAFGWLTDRGFRVVEILRKSNIDLAWIDENGIWKKAAKPELRDVVVLAGSGSDAGNIRESVKAYLLGTLCETDGAPSPLEKVYQDEHGRMGRLPRSARSALVDAVDAAVKGRLVGWFMDPVKEGTGAILSGGLAADAHPVNLQIDRLVVSEGDSPDFNENLSGYGLLMRRSRPADEWRCLTAIFAEIDPDTTYNGVPTAVAFETAPETVMGALPVAYSSRMPQAMAVYDNRPVVGDNLADVVIEEQPGDAPDPRIVRLYQPVVQRDPPKETLLPFLAYGATYEAAPFGISNHGALPEIIRRDDHPAILDPGKLTQNLFPDGSEFVRHFSYLRRTGVGSLRVKPIVAPLQNQGILFHPMAPPKGTKPLAEEIFVPARAITPWLKLKPDLPNGTLKMKTALLLADEKQDPLLDARENINYGELKLEISAPLTPLEDFDRWIAFEEATLPDADKDKLRQFRKRLRTFHHDQTAVLHDTDIEYRKALAAGDRTSAGRLKLQLEKVKAALDLQDPAVGALAISVTRVRRDGALENGSIAGFKPELIDWTWQWAPAMDPENPFAASRKPLDFFCKIDRDRTKPLFDKGSNSIWLAAGDVVIARLFAAVPDELFTEKVAPDGRRRFDSAVLAASVGEGTDATLVTNPNGDKFRLFAMHLFAVEAASPGLPSDVELASTIAGSIVGDVPSAADEQPGDVRLDFKRLPSTAMDSIGAISVGSQAWRWTGRPLGPFPFAQARNLNGFPAQPPQDPGTGEPPSPSEYALLWDVQGFAERLDETLNDETAAVAINEKLEAGISKPQATRVSLKSPARLDTARYMRFRAVASGRYAPAYAAARKSVAPREAGWKSADGSWTTPWYRMLRPAMQPDAVPKPGIRALVPLTRALREGDTMSPVAGILAVVDGAWFEHAGLADWMVAGVEVAYRKKLVTAAGTVVSAAAAEMGPDGLVRTYGLGKKEQTTPDEKGLRTAVPLEAVGPMGHGFDTGTATGLYLNSSFVVRAPKFAESDAGAWWMGKLAFRRLVLAEGTRDYWTTSVLTPLTSATPQVSATLHSIAAAADPATLNFKAVGKLLSTTTSQPEAGLVVQAKWLNGSWLVEVSDMVSGAADTFAINEPTFDLRVLAVRRLSRVSPDNPEQYAWYEILVLAKPETRQWILACQSQWFNDSKLAEGKDTSAAALEIDFVTVSQTGVTIGDKHVGTSLQVSEATEGRWTQFMPSADVLARSNRILLADIELSVDPNSNIKLRLASKGNPLAWLATEGLTRSRGQGKADQGLFNLLLVTQSVASVSGTDEEAYVGIYHSPAGYDVAAKAVPLSWFDRGPPKPLDNNNLIGRILTVRTGKPDMAGDPVGSWGNDPWKRFFPAEQIPNLDASQVFGEKRPPDSGAQIIEIYAPIYSRPNGT